MDNKDDRDPMDMPANKPGYKHTLSSNFKSDPRKKMDFTGVPKYKNYTGSHPSINRPKDTAQSVGLPVLQDNAKSGAYKKEGDILWL